MQKRTDLFFKLRDRMDNEPAIVKIIKALDEDNQSEAFLDITIQEKRKYLRFLEELALTKNAKLISIEIAHYMFGYYAINAWNSIEFWNVMDDEKEHRYWRLVKYFIKELEEQSDQFEEVADNPKKFKNFLNFNFTGLET